MWPQFLIKHSSHIAEAFLRDGFDALQSVMILSHISVKTVVEIAASGSWSSTSNSGTSDFEFHPAIALLIASPIVK
jgi:hypothetical protein